VNNSPPNMHFFFQLPKSNLGDLSYAASKNQKLRKILPKVFKEPEISS